MPWRVRRPKIRERLRRDAALRLELSLCHEWGIPHSRFLSWDHRDRAKAIAYALEKGARCPSCGTADWEWKEDPDAYQAVHEFCLGCYRREAAQDADLPAGTTVVLIPTDSDEWRQAMDDMEARHKADSQTRKSGGF